jgi:methylmalonyl-CoA/ethylmalonyl-CoA epimerase
MSLGTLGFDNIGIAVTNLTDAVSFYERLGFVAEYNDGNAATLKNGSASLYVFTSIPGRPSARKLDMLDNPAGIDHISFAVADVDAVAEALRTNDVVVESGPTDQEWGRRTVTVVDPDGNRFWFLGPLAQATTQA